MAPVKVASEVQVTVDKSKVVVVKVASEVHVIVDKSDVVAGGNGTPVVCKESSEERVVESVDVAIRVLVGIGDVRII